MSVEELLLLNPGKLIYDLCEAPPRGNFGKVDKFDGLPEASRRFPGS
jgi:hypothetical protein